MSIDLSTRPYWAGCSRFAIAIPMKSCSQQISTDPGDAVLVRLAPFLQHRVTAVGGRFSADLFSWAVHVVQVRALSRSSLGSTGVSSPDCGPALQDRSAGAKSWTRSSRGPQARGSRKSRSRDSSSVVKAATSAAARARSMSKVSTSLAIRSSCVAPSMRARPEDPAGPVDRQVAGLTEVEDDQVTLDLTPFEVRIPQLQASPRNQRISAISANVPKTTANAGAVASALLVRPVPGASASSGALRPSSLSPRNLLLAFLNPASSPQTSRDR